MEKRLRFFAFEKISSKASSMMSFLRLCLCIYSPLAPALKLCEAIAIEMAMYVFRPNLCHFKRKLLYLHGVHTLFQQVTLLWKLWIRFFSCSFHVYLSLPWLSTWHAWKWAKFHYDFWISNHKSGQFLRAQIKISTTTRRKNRQWLWGAIILMSFSSHHDIPTAVNGFNFTSIYHISPNFIVFLLSRQIESTSRA